jgi:hypothetical protein
MVKQRQESARAYEEGGRLELAEKERAEVLVIEEFLPRQLSGEEISAAVDQAIAATGAEGIRDMGRVMGELKARYAGQMDFAAVGPLVKDRRPEPPARPPRQAASSLISSPERSGEGSP